MTASFIAEDEGQVYLLYLFSISYAACEVMKDNLTYFESDRSASRLLWGRGPIFRYLELIHYPSVGC